MQQAPPESGWKIAGSLSLFSSFTGRAVLRGGLGAHQCGSTSTRDLQHVSWLVPATLPSPWYAVSPSVEKRHGAPIRAWAGRTRLPPPSNSTARCRLLTGIPMERRTRSRDIKPGPLHCGELAPRLLRVSTQLRTRDEALMRRGHVDVATHVQRAGGSGSAQRRSHVTAVSQGASDTVFVYCLWYRLVCHCLVIGVDASHSRGWAHRGGHRERKAAL